jgi:outer membrane protein OmpA-like peptidoglycan-associated protein
MQYRVLKALSAAAALVPTLAIAQQRPATPPPAARPTTTTTTTTTTTQRPAATPARRVAGPSRDKAWEFTVSGSIFSVDGALADRLVVSGIRDDNSRFMFGGDLGINKHFGKNLAIGIGSGLGVGQGAMVLTPRFDIQIGTNINNKTSLYIPIGVGVTRHTAGGPTDANRITSTFGVHGGLGLRSFLSDNVALRLEGRMTYDKYDETFNNGDQNAFNGQGSFGLAFFVGGAPPRDTDMDGVVDKKDRCAATPRGALVDVNGCPRDTDRDRVWDGIDRCANTPANTPVDATGCPLDTDRDGVNDAADRCPNTTAGTPVDANGCPRDADGDGVADNLDRCANTPRGTPVDANGCPRDADSDGVADNMDRCPNTPAGTPVDANGCPRDADGDGVADGADRCAGSPAGTRVDANGCPLAPDADRDGVEDSRDRCPATPAGRNVDANGCPLAELPAVGASLVIRNINFVSGRANLTAASAQPLRDLAISIQAILRTNPNARFEVAGYTDSRGSAASNRTLSQRRAESVKTAMTTAGVPANALTAVGYGPDSPKAPNTTAAGRAQNRRVEIKRLS